MGASETQLPQYFDLPSIWALRAISTCVKLGICETMQQSNGLLIFTNRHFLKANIETYFQGLDFRTGGATLYQKLTGGIPPVPPALTEALSDVNM